MYVFLIKNDGLLKKCNKFWDNVSNSIKKRVDSVQPSIQLKTCNKNKIILCS